MKFKFCPNCGNELGEGFAFCPNCGFALGAQEKPSIKKEAKRSETITSSSSDSGSVEFLDQILNHEEQKEFQKYKLKTIDKLIKEGKYNEARNQINNYLNPSDYEVLFRLLAISRATNYEQDEKMYSERIKGDGSAEANYILGICTLKSDEEEGLALLKKASDLGHEEAQIELAKRNAVNDLKDAEKYDSDGYYHAAVSMYEKVAKTGNLKDTFRRVFYISNYYDIDSRTKKKCRDFLDKYFNIVLQEAENGDAEYQYLIGEAYYRGIYVEKDSFTAIKWYEKSAAQDYLSAVEKLVYNFEHTQLNNSNRDEVYRQIYKYRDQLKTLKGK